MTITIVDLETSGIDFNSDSILEIGALSLSNDLTDFKGHFHSIVKYNPDRLQVIKNSAVPVVQDMHDRNHLWKDCEGEIGQESTLNDVIDEFFLWVESFHQEEETLLAGDCVYFDFFFLYRQDKDFQSIWDYHFIDTSNPRTAAKLWDPTLARAMKYENDLEEGLVEEPHRVIPDCFNTLKKLYKIQYRMREMPNDNLFLNPSEQELFWKFEKRVYTALYNKGLVDENGGLKSVK